MVLPAVALGMLTSSGLHTSQHVTDGLWDSRIPQEDTANSNTARQQKNRNCECDHVTFDVCSKREHID
jgi:hypothetical protein